MMQKLRLILCLTIAFKLFSIEGTAQVVLNDSVARAVLKDLAELDYRREMSRIDSATIVDLLKAYEASDSALTYSNKSIESLKGIIENDARISAELHKEIRNEKVKRKATILGGVILVVAAVLL